MYYFIVKCIDLSSTGICAIKYPKLVLLLLPKVVICKAALDPLLYFFSMIIKYDVNEIFSCLLAEQFVGLI